MTVRWCAVLVWVVAVACGAQGGGPVLSKRAQAVKEKAEHLQSGATISVVRIGADEEFGRFLASGPESFTFYDEDLKLKVTLPYEGVKKIKDGTGGYNPLRHRHVDRTRSLVIVVLAAGVLVALIAAAASA